MDWAFYATIYPSSLKELERTIIVNSQIPFSFLKEKTKHKPHNMFR